MTTTILAFSIIGIIAISLVGGFVAVMLLISIAKLTLLLCVKLMPRFFHNVTENTRNCGQNTYIRVNNINNFENIHNWLYAKLTRKLRVIPSNFINASKRQPNPRGNCHSKYNNGDIESFLPSSHADNLPQEDKSVNNPD
jgi:hypothetical protein